MVQDYRASSYKKIAGKGKSNSAGGRFETTGGRVGYASGGVSQIKEGGKEESGRIIYSGGGSSGGTTQLREGSVVTSEVSSQVAISGGPSQNVATVSERVGERTITAAKLAGAQPSPTEQSPFSPQKVQVSPGVAEKIEKKSLRGDQQYFVEVQPHARKLPQSVDTSPKTYYERQTERIKNVGGLKGIGESLILSGVYEIKGGISQPSLLRPSIIPITSGTNKIVTGFGFFASGTLLEQNIKIENGEIGITPELLIGAGLGLQSARPSARTVSAKPIPDVERATTSAEFKSFLAKENIKPGSIITQQDALKIQEFFLKYNRDAQATSLVKATDTRLVKVKPSQGKGSDTEVSVELQLSPIEEINVRGRTKNLGSIQEETRYLIVKKGEAEFVDPRKIPKVDYLELVGTQNVGTAPVKQVPIEGLLQIESKTKFLPNTVGTVGEVSTSVKQGVSIQRPVKDFISAERFDELLKLKGATVKGDDFVQVIESLDFSQAKVFKSTITRTGDFGVLPNVVEDTRLGVRAFQSKPVKDFNLNLKRIGRYKNVPGQPEQLEDLRFRLEYVDKKLLTAENIREVVELEKGYAVRLYTWDGKVRGFRSVEAYIPKPGVSKDVGVTSFANIVKKNQPVSSDIGGVSSGEEQVLVQPGTIAVGKVKVEPPKGESKMGVKVEPPKQYTATPEPKYYYREGYGFESGGKIYTPTGEGARVVVAGKSRGLFGFARISSGKVDVGRSVDARPAIDVGGISTSKPISKSLSVSDVASASRSATESASDTLQQSIQIQRFRPQNIRSEWKPEPQQQRPKFPRLDIPDLDGKRGGFGVSVRRFGSFKPIATGLSREAATALGGVRVRGSAAASFQVTKGGRAVEVSAPAGFYRKGATLIEQQRFRINTPGELKEITFMGISASRNKKKSSVGGL